MSDLDQAVQAEIDAWAPRAAPPAFDALAGRKRARDRRRLATAGAALSAVAIAGAAALGPSLGGGRDELPTVGSSPAPTAPASGEDLDALVERCLTGFTAAPVPGLVGMAEKEAFPPNVRSALRVLAQNGECTDERLAGDGATYLVLEDGEVVWAGRLNDLQEGPVEALPVPPRDPAGAEICKDPTAPDAAVECYDVGPEQAERLAGALATARPLRPGAAECMALPVAVYRITWIPASGLLDPVVWTVPSGLCLPMTVGETKYDLPDEAQADVGRIWSAAGLYPVDEVTTGRRAPSPPRG